MKPFNLIAESNWLNDFTEENIVHSFSCLWKKNYHVSIKLLGLEMYIWMKYKQKRLFDGHKLFTQFVNT